MNKNDEAKISRCQYDLENKGFTKLKLDLPTKLKRAVKNEDFPIIDKIVKEMTDPPNLLFNIMSKFCDVKEIEFIISLRDAQNEWEEDGIWHDDGSRIMAFSLSLTLGPVEGGILEIRKKGAEISHKIPTPDYANIIIFKTGISNFEHKINKVTKGKRLIIAGWCYPERGMF